METINKGKQTEISLSRVEDEIKKIEGDIVFKSKKYNRLIERKVGKNNSTSGKITVPKHLINKKVYVVWFEEEEK